MKFLTCVIALTVLGFNMAADNHSPGHNDQYYEGYKHIEGYPQYMFEYSVHDDHTGDHKHHKETRKGHKVLGEYSLLEPDGATRVVSYDADKDIGFNAVVKRIEPVTDDIEKNVFAAGLKFLSKSN